VTLFSRISRREKSSRRMRRLRIQGKAPREVSICGIENISVM
jgi:ribosomal protein L25 (general stress protein Ctc)